MSFQNKQLLNCRESSLQTIGERLKAIAETDSHTELAVHWLDEMSWRPPGTVDICFDGFLGSQKDVEGLIALMWRMESELEGEDSAYLAGVIARFLAAEYESIDSIHLP